MFPNTFFHQNEPGLLGPSDQIFKNVIIQGNFDPNIKPDPFKYASTLYYIQAFIRGTTLFLIYETNKLTGSNFGRPDKAFNVSFKEFVLDNGPHFFEYPMLWAARFFTALLGVGCVFLIYLIALKLFRNRTIALFSAAALAVMPLHVRNSHYALADIPQVFFFLFSFLASLHMYNKKTIKAYLMTGFLVGFATSLKYFPLPLIPFFIFHLLIKEKFFSTKLLWAFIGMFGGYWLGMPYLFVHFDKIINFIPYALTWYAPDKLDTQKSVLEKLLPQNLHSFHLKFLFTKAMLPIPFIVSLIGLFIGLKNFRKPTSFTLIIPVTNIIFIFFYVHQVYEHLSLPMLPFMAVFIGIAAYYFTTLKVLNRFFCFLLVLLILFLPSLISSLKASVACSTEIPEYQSRDWIRNNIPLKSNFAFEPGSRLPSEINVNWIKSEFPQNFSLSELQELGANYLMIMNGYYGVYLTWSEDELFPSKLITNNQYPQLVINEYVSSAKKIKEFVKPYMCISNEIYIYQIPPALSKSSHELKYFNFDNQKGMENFRLLDTREETSIKYEDSKGYKSLGALRYFYAHGKFNKWRYDYNFAYATSIESEHMTGEENKKYTLEAWVLPESGFKTNIRDFFLRINYYNKDNKLINTSLSSRTKNLNKWQNLSITSLAPQGTFYISIGFQGLAPEESGSFLIDNITLYAD